MKITLRGMEDAEKQMERIEKGLKSLQNYAAEIGSGLPYAYGIEEGRHQVSGKLARRAGGSFYIRRAVDTVLGDADSDLAEGLKKVTAPGVWVVRRLGLWARRLAGVNAPHGPRGKGRSYRLRRSINYQVRKL